MHRTATTGKRKLNITATNKILLCNNLSVTNLEPYYDTCNCVNNYGTPKNLWQPKSKHLPKLFHKILKMFALTHFQPMFHFYNPWKQKSRGFLMFSGVSIGWKWVKLSFLLYSFHFPKVILVTYLQDQDMWKYDFSCLWFLTSTGDTPISSAH